MRFFILFCRKFLLLIFYFGILFNSLSEIELINDAETEKFLHDMIDLIYASQNKKNPIKILLAKTNAVNAFATFDNYVCVFTGLLTNFAADEIFAVLAHEIGHISCNHIPKKVADFKKKTLIEVLTFPLFPILGTLLVEDSLAFSRIQEREADGFAMKVFKENSFSLESMKKMMLGLQQNTDLNLTKDIRQNWLPRLTHPSEHERILRIKEFEKKYEYQKKAFPEEFKIRLKYIKAKFLGCTKNPEEYFSSHYMKRDSFEKYGAIYAFNRLGDYKKAIDLANQLLKTDVPKEFLYEMKAQIEFENGDFEKSIEDYDNAIKIYKNVDFEVGKARAILGIKNISHKKILDEIDSLMKYEDKLDKIVDVIISCYGKINDELMLNYWIARKHLLIFIESGSKSSLDLKKSHDCISRAYQLIPKEKISELSKKIEAEFKKSLKKNEKSLKTQKKQNFSQKDLEQKKKDKNYLRILILYRYIKQYIAENNVKF